ncbi:MAG TPA: GrpB family protein [Chloroflexota bacterium]|nr:GrpB family protein [Chloroflexota bacterium]
MSACDPAWPGRFQVERDRVVAALGELIAEVEHSGSTAVPDMVAKPIIDVLVGLADFSNTPQTVAPLEAIGYTSGELRPGWMFLRTNDPHDRHLHVVELGSDDWQSQLDFRDALRADPELVATYERVKIDLAERFADDRAGYTTGKTEFVQSVLKRVRAGD